MVREEIGALVTQSFNELDEFGNTKENWDSLIKSVGTIIPVTPEIMNKMKEESANAADREFAIADALYKFDENFWQEKETGIGKELFEGAQRYVALQALDTLWMEHLDTMDHLRDSVRLRGYGQRDPLVEYKKEGYQMFQRLVGEINKQIVYSIFHIGVTVNPQPQQAQAINMVTNQPGSSTPAPQTNASGEAIGRNEPCPCGSGKKYKNCCGRVA